VLRFRLRRHDLQGGWRGCDAGWTAGGSRIEPYRHRALTASAVSDGRRLVVWVRERLGPNRPGSGPDPIRRASSEDLVRFCDVAREHPLDYVLLEVAPDDLGGVRLEAGTWGSAPVYFAAGPDGLWGDWDPARLYGVLPSARLDAALASRFLATCGHPYSWRTLFADLSVLTERGRATWQDGRLRYDYPPPAPRARARMLRPDVDPVDVFRTILATSLPRWLDPARPRVATELSGGLDSATIGVVGAALTEQPVRTYGLIVPGPTGAAQRRRRDELVARFGFVDCALESGALAPRLSARREPLAPWLEFYREAFETLLRRMHAAGDDVIFTGLGGDELFLPAWDELDADEQAGERRAAEAFDRALPAHLTPLAVEAYREAPPAGTWAPAAFLPHSALQSAAAGAPLYLAAGVWAAHPLATPELVRFCASLPRAWRDDRALQRALLARAGCSREVTHPRTTEAFDGLMDLGLREHDRDGLAALFAEPRLAELGLVDAGELRRAYRRYCDHEGDGQTSIFTAAALEVAVREAEQACTAGAAQEER
jgi:asparagine synthase (glutamine-hydrolysing)